MVTNVRYDGFPGRLFQSVYRANSNVILNKILLVVFPIFLQIECEWILKKYRVDNDTSIHYSPSGLMRNIDDAELEYFEWLMKRYIVNNDDEIDYGDYKLE